MKFLRISLLVCLWAFSAHGEVSRDLNRLDFEKAEQEIFKTSFGMKSLFGTSFSNGTGLLMGGSWSGYLTEFLSVGAVGYGGVLVGGNSPSSGGMGYGGIQVAYDFYFHEDWLLTGSTLAGMGGGRTAGNESKFGIALEPQISVSRILSRGIRGSLGLSYLYFPTMTSLSGYAVSLNLDLRRFLLVFPD